MAKTTLSPDQGAGLLLLVVFGALMAGLVITKARKTAAGDVGSTQPGSIVRSWIAISLVMGLLVFCGAAFWIDDQTLRSTLLGGLVASVGAAIAFYFSSKTTEQAVNAAMTLSHRGPNLTVYPESGSSVETGGRSSGTPPVGPPPVGPPPVGPPPVGPPPVGPPSGGPRVGSVSPDEPVSGGRPVGGPPS